MWIRDLAYMAAAGILYVTLAVIAYVFLAGLVHFGMDVKLALGIVLLGALVVGYVWTRPTSS